MPDKASLAVYAAILKLKAEDKDSFIAEVFATNLINQPSTYTMLNPYCEICGKQINRENSELHHIAGKKHSTYHIIHVCLECHSVLSERQKLWDKRWWHLDQPDHVRKAFLLQGISDILRLKTRKTGNPEYEMLADQLTEAISMRLKQ